MIRTTLKCLLFLFSALNISAQTADSVSKPKIQFCSKNELGGLIGIGRLKDASDYPTWNPEWAVELISTNGIRYEPWFVGVGFGIRAWGADLTFPLFVNVSLDLWKSAFFLHAHLGNQFGTRKINYQGDKETGNFYAAYGLGYNFSIKKQVCYVKASICHQRANAVGEAGGLGPSTYPEHYSLTYTFCRISLGLRFTK